MTNSFWLNVMGVLFTVQIILTTVAGIVILFKICGV